MENMSLNPAYAKRLKTYGSRLVSVKEFFSNRTVLTLFGMGFVNTAQAIFQNDTMTHLMSDNTLYWVNTVLGILGVIFRSRGH